MPSSRSSTLPHNHSHTNHTHGDPHQPFTWSSNGSKGGKGGHSDPVGRTLVLCFDGTGDKFDSTNSNVVRFFSMLAKGDPERQMVYYQAGIGTYFTRYIGWPIRREIARTVDLMFATSLKQHIIDGYNFLMQNYRDNDKICILGFSRGAYSALCLAGMLYKVGLLTPGNFQQVPFAYKLYCDDTVKGWSESLQFKRTFSLNVDIEFVGVWDTVASVGMSSRHLPLTRENPAIKTFRHAIALDEHRVKFTPSLYQRGDLREPAIHRQSDVNMHLDNETLTRRPCCVQQNEEEAHRQDLFQRICAYNVKKETKAFAKRFSKKLVNAEENVADTFDKLEEYYSNRPNATDVLEVWFAGCHCDVGGGNVPNGTKHSLANIPLRWMIRQCILANTGILFDTKKLHSIGIDLDPITGLPLSCSTRKPEDNETSSTLTRVDSNGSNMDTGADNSSSTSGTLAYAMNSWHNEANARGDKLSSLETFAYAADIPLHNEANAHGDASDAICLMYDQLELRRRWWIIECLPIVVIDWEEKESGLARKRVRANFGRARFKTQDMAVRNIKVHDSVRLRMEKLGYRPRINVDGAVWVH